MTADPIIPFPSVRALPIPFDGDLVIDFRNRDPANPTVYVDYPTGASGIFTIYSDRKTSGATRIAVTATPAGPHCIIKIAASALNGVEAGTKWSYRMKYPDADLPNGYNKVIVNGLVVRSDGTA